MSEMEGRFESKQKWEKLFFQTLLCASFEFWLDVGREREIAAWRRRQMMFKVMATVKFLADEIGYNRHVQHCNLWSAETATLYTLGQQQQIDQLVAAKKLEYHEVIFNINANLQHKTSRQQYERARDDDDGKQTSPFQS